MHLVHMLGIVTVYRPPGCARCMTLSNCELPLLYSNRTGCSESSKNCSHPTRNSQSSRQVVSSFDPKLYCLNDLLTQSTPMRIVRLLPTTTSADQRGGEFCARSLVKTPVLGATTALLQGSSHNWSVHGISFFGTSR